MNVYDFDGTIYAGDSTVDFFLYSLKKHPSLLRYLPKQAWGFLLYFCKRISKRRLKEYFFSFLKGTDLQCEVDSFWEEKRGKIYDWYLGQQAPEDMVISASPTFLLAPICSCLGIKYLIASAVDPKTGRFTGENCRGEEKVRRLTAEYKVTHIDKFYSDSRADLPLAKIADAAYLVKNGAVREWKGLSDHAQKQNV